MKKLILALFILCSAIAFSQGTIPIPQIIGLPSALASKVDKVTGKSLVADTSIVKLTGVQAAAQVNKIEGIQKNGVDLPITGKKVNITVPTTASDISAEPANTNIQSHISSTSNPHSVTKSQVGLGNVDNTSDINKPISTATQTALDGKQLIGTYATGTGTANGTNTGDETLTSIKTKLGAASSVSDGYLTYNMFNIFNGKEPSFTKNTAFNKNFGTTTGTILEGRTFGTAANSAVGDFVHNQYVSPQPADILISGRAQFQTYVQSTKLSLGDGTDVDSNGSVWYGLTNRAINGVDFNGYSGINFNVSGGNAITIGASRDATLNGNVYLNKTLYVNSPTSSTYQSYLKSNQAENNAFELGISGHKLITSGNYYLGSILNLWSNDAIRMTFDASGTGIIHSTTPSTSPTTGALVVNGGGGFGGKVYASGFAKTGGSSTQVWTTDGGYIESSSVGGASGNGSLTVVGSSNFGSATVISHTYSVIGNIVTESIACSGTPSSSGVFWIDVAPQYESKATGFTPTGTGTLNNETIYPALAWIYKSPTSVVRLSSSNGIASANNRITIVIQYEKQ